MGSEITPKIGELAQLYAKLGHLMDAYWFMETEKRFGYKAAYEIDEAVWKKYPRKEARWLKRFLGMDELTVEDIKTLLSYSLFNTTLDYTIEEVDSTKENEKVLQFRVNHCKTLTGMQKVKRSGGEIYKICEGIGIAFFEAFLQELVPGAEIACLFCPHDNRTPKIKQDKLVCAWEFRLPGLP